jgi:hypothetical protein
MVDTMKRGRDGVTRVQPVLDERTRVLRELNSLVSPLFYASLLHREDTDLVKLLRDLRASLPRQTQ